VSCASSVGVLEFLSLLGSEFRVGARSDQIFVGSISGGRSAAEVDMFVLGDQPLGPDCFEEVEQIVLDDDGFRFRVLDDVLDLGADQPEIDRHYHEPSLGHRRVDFHPFEAVVREDRDPIALLEPKSEERIGGFAGTFIPVAEGQGPSEIARSDLVRTQIGVNGDDKPK
jgi:hypothetical protein